MTEAGDRADPLAVLWAAAGSLWPMMVLAGTLLIAVQPPQAVGPATGLALLPLAACHRLGQRMPVAVACVVAALGGLSLDIVEQGPLGFHGLIFAAAAALGAETRRLEPSGLGARWGVFGAHLVALAVLQGALVTACTLAAPAWGPIVRQSVVAALLYPVIAGMVPVAKVVAGAPARARLAGP